MGLMSPNPEGTGAVPPAHKGMGSVSPDPSNTGPVSPDPEGMGAVPPYLEGTGSVSPDPLGAGSASPSEVRTTPNHYGSKHVGLGQASDTRRGAGMP